MNRLCVAAALLLLPLAWVMPQQDPVLHFEDFEDGTSDFISVDPVANLTITSQQERVFAGDGSLQLSYVQEAMSPGAGELGVPGALVLPLPDGIAEVEEIAFALRSRMSTPVVAVLGEGEDGPRYSCLLWSSAEKWSEFSLTPGDFTLDRDGPADPNGQLDLDEVNGLAIIDGDGFVRMIEESAPLFYSEPAAEQALWLDEFTLRSVSPTSPEAAEGPTALADYSPPMRGFLTIGGRDLTVTSEEQADGRSTLRMDYSVPAGTLFGLMHSVAPGALTDAAAIRMEARTNRKLTLVVVLEERRGPEEINKSRYEMLIELEPSDDFEMITLPFSLFELGEDQTDPDGALDLKLVDTFSIADATAIFEGSEVINTLRLTAPVVTQ